MILSVKDQLIQFWEVFKTYIPTIITFAIALFTATMQALVKKSITKENFESIAQQTIDKTYAQIGNVALSLNVEPILEQKTKEFVSTATSEIEKKYEELETAFKQTNEILIALLSTQTNNVVISEEVRETIQKVIDNYYSVQEIETAVNEPVKVEISVKSEEKTEETKSTEIDR